MSCTAHDSPRDYRLVYSNRSYSCIPLAGLALRVAVTQLTIMSGVWMRGCRSVFYKQHAARFFQPSAYALATMLVQVREGAQPHHQHHCVATPTPSIRYHPTCFTVTHML